MNHLDRTVQILAYVAVAGIIVLSLVPGSARPQTGAPGQGEHVIAYLITALLFGMRSNSVSNLIALGIVLVAGAGALEFAQQWVPGRNAQLGDFIASSIGILIGLAIGGALNPFYRRFLSVWTK
jgi:VanZ family protein